MADLSEVIKAYDVRGIVPDQLDEAACRAIGAAFADEIGGAGGTGGTGVTVVIGHDMRDTSPALSAAFADGVLARGGDAILIGLCSTDGLYFASGSLHLPGAMFTASHNPAQYNGIKLCRAGARPISAETGLAQVAALAQGYLDDGIPPATRRGTARERDLLRPYAAHLRELVDLSGLRRPLRVVVDAGNGMAGLTAPAVLGTAAGLPALPVEVVPLYFELDGTFPHHEANPLEPENLRDLQAAVPAHQADLGLAFDGDADRCFVVDERGAAVSPSAITALIARREIARELAAGRQPTVLYNLISSRAVPEIIAEAGGRGVRTRVGHSFIKADMARTGAVFGGEHSAHYYFRDFWGADTGMLAALHVLAALGGQGEGRDQPLSELAGSDERYVASGEINSRVADAAAVLTRIRAAYGGEQLDDLDGLSIVHRPASAGDPLWWFNVRTSNTEPLLRLNVEAADAETMVRVRDEVLAVVKGTS